MRESRHRARGDTPRITAIEKDCSSTGSARTRRHASPRASRDDRESGDGRCGEVLRHRHGLCRRDPSIPTAVGAHFEPLRADDPRIFLIGVACKFALFIRFALDLRRTVPSATACRERFRELGSGCVGRLPILLGLLWNRRPDPWSQESAFCCFGVPRPCRFRGLRILSGITSTCSPTQISNLKRIFLRAIIQATTFQNLEREVGNWRECRF